MHYLTFGLLLALPAAASAADWPQFLGPNRDNTTAEQVAPWTGEPTVAWKRPIGDAHSSPVVADGVVYAFHQPKGTNADALTAFDAVTGEQKWEQSYEREKFDPPFGPGPRGTPAVVGSKVYTLGGTGILACWDAANGGKLVWKVDTLKDFNVENLVFGVSTSPLVAGGKVFVNVGGKGAGIVAFDADTGKVVWKATDDAASYASPILIQAGGAEQVVFNTRINLRGLDPANGDVFWTYPFRDPTLESATTPLRTDDLLIGSSVKLGSVALKLTERDNKPAVEPVWKKEELNCYFSTPVAVGKHLYMLNGILSITPSITLRCIEAETGRILWERPKVGSYHAALIRTGDDKLIMLDDTGHLTMFAADPAGYKELARSKVCGPTWAHPALVDGKLYIRDEKELICLDMK
jgi:outer membrane protein assembly factor BamB